MELDDGWHLSAFVLGELDDVTRTSVEQALTRDARLRSEVARVRAEIVGLTIALLKRADGGPAVRLRRRSVARRRPNRKGS